MRIKVHETRPLAALVQSHHGALQEVLVLCAGSELTGAHEYKAVCLTY